MKFIALTSLVILSFPAISQKKAPNPKPYAATITAEDLKRHLLIVASAEMEGRDTGTPGERKAAAYIENQLKSSKLQPGKDGSFQQYFPVYRDSLVNATLSVNEQVLTVNEDFQPNSLGSEGKLYFSEVTYVGYGIIDSAYNSYGNANVAGKAIVVMSGGPTGLRGGTGRFSSTGTQAKITHARTKGAAAVFIVSSAFMPTTNISPRMYVNLYRDAQYPPTFLISEKTAEKLLGPEWNQLKTSLPTVKPEPKAFTVNVGFSLSKEIQKKNSSNVLGVLEGTDKKDEYLVITAHYDHVGKRGNDIYYGANDDGSGTVSVLEIAEAFAKAKAEGKGPRRSIIFMTVSGEEKGLWGSAYYAAHPTVNPEKITANLNIDMLGRLDIERKKLDSLNYVYVVGDDKISSESTPLNEGVNNKYTKLGLDYKYNDPKDPQRIYYRSDHYNFAKIGIPIIFYTDGAIKPDYHKPTDTPDKIDYKLLAKRAQLIFYAAWEMANRETMLKRDRPLPKE